jgi:hypothetical protein
MFSNHRTRGLLAILLCVAAVATTSCSSSPSVSSALPAALSAAGPLIESVTKAVPGLSQAQAILGTGSLLGLAKNNMPADQFSQVSTALPGADALVNEAVKQGLPATGNTLASVTSFLGKSGISPEQVNQLVGAVNGVLKDKVPGPISDAFAAALK